MKLVARALRGAVSRLQSSRRSYTAVNDIDEAYVSSDKYKQEIIQARARIFGYAIGNNLQSGTKILRKKLIGEQLVKWYPLPVQHLDERFQDPRLERRMEKLELKRRQGKIKHKRGKNKAPAAPPAKGKKK